MKKTLLYSCIIFVCTLSASTSQVFAGMPRFGKGENKVITQDINDVVGEEIINSEKVLREEIEKYCLAKRMNMQICFILTKSIFQPLGS